VTAYRLLVSFVVGVGGFLLGLVVVALLSIGSHYLKRRSPWLNRASEKASTVFNWVLLLLFTAALTSIAYGWLFP